MITKAEILNLAKYYSLQPTTIQKDYVIGWLLKAISDHPQLSQWVFKGGTCLKKCYFETYRFSEDLDFTIPLDQSISNDLIEAYLEQVTAWIEDNSGLTFPRQDWKINKYTNPRGNTSFQVKISFDGPLLSSSKKSLPRLKFDLTQDEIIVNTPELRNVHHGFSDEFNPSPQILCYTINEFLAEKSRALFERNGRARDVYDIVNISRNFRQEIDPQRTKDIADAKFEFKGLEAPTVKQIIGAINQEVLKSNWNHQLTHQISNLPPVETFLNDLKDAIAWWLEPAIAKPTLQPVVSGQKIPRTFFPAIGVRTGSSLVMEIIRRAAHNRQCVLISYHGHRRLVEPYSIRFPSTVNVLLYVREIEKDGMPSSKRDHPTAYKTHEINSASVSDKTFIPKWEIEL